MKRNLERLPLLLLSLFFPISLFRLIVTVVKAWNSFGGDFIASFPLYFLLKYYNPALYQSLGNQPWFPNTWFYGPIHHLWLFPLTFLTHSTESFFRALTIIYICLILTALFMLFKVIAKTKDYLFLFAYFAVTLGSFQLLDNLGQRNVELLEFVLIIFAFLCLRKNREYSAGSLLSIATMAKVLPVIFLPYLLLKKKFKAIVAFLITLIIIFIISQITLDWRKSALFSSHSMQIHGLPSLQKIIGSNYLAPIRPASSSFYLFILTFFAKIDMSNYVPTITYKVANFFAPNLIFLGLAFIIFTLSFSLIYKTGKKGNLLDEFSIVCLVMLLIFPHGNPYYFVFTLLAFISILKIFSVDSNGHQVSLRKKFIIFIIYVLSLLAMGSLIPFRLYEKIFPLKNVVLHYFTTYNIFGLAAFVLWCLMTWLYWNEYKVVDKT